MNQLLLAVALWVVGGWVGAQASAFIDRRTRLGFWSRLGAGVLGGVLLGGAVERAPVLAPLGRLLENGHVEDVLAGAVGGFTLAFVGGVLAWIGSFGRSRERNGAS